MLHTFCSSNAARQITDLQTSWCPLTTKTELFSTNSATCYALAYDMWQNSTFSIDISRSRPLYHVTNPQSQFARSCEGVAQLKDINIGKGKKMVCSKPFCLNSALEICAKNSEECLKCGETHEPKACRSVLFSYLLQRHNFLDFPLDVYWFNFYCMAVKTI